MSAQLSVLIRPTKTSVFFKRKVPMNLGHIAKNDVTTQQSKKVFIARALDKKSVQFKHRTRLNQITYKIF